eukprot:9546837-Ditylum_brightwellii.AAC.1
MVQVPEGLSTTNITISSCQSQHVLPMPYMVLLETDGGPDHNTTFLNTQLSFLVIFLLSEMDKLVRICCCPASSYLNTEEQLMSVLNLGLNILALTIDPDTPKWLQEEVLKDCSSMKMIRAAVDAYDKEHPKAVAVLPC